MLAEASAQRQDLDSLPAVELGFNWSTETDQFKPALFGETYVIGYKFG